MAATAAAAAVAAAWQQAPPGRTRQGCPATCPALPQALQLVPLLQGRSAGLPKLALSRLDPPCSVSSRTFRTPSNHAGGVAGAACTPDACEQSLAGELWLRTRPPTDAGRLNRIVQSERNAVETHQKPGGRAGCAAAMSPPRTGAGISCLQSATSQLHPAPWPFIRCMPHSPASPWS